jgi:hypothetical protein
MTDYKRIASVEYIGIVGGRNSFLPVLFGSVVMDNGTVGYLLLSSLGLHGEAGLLINYTSPNPEPKKNLSMSSFVSLIEKPITCNLGTKHRSWHIPSPCWMLDNFNQPR